jgi:hypothetical protein
MLRFGITMFVVGWNVWHLHPIGEWLIEKIGALYVFYVIYITLCIYYL